MVSGGVSVGFGIKETAIKEAAEEASIPESLAQKIVRANHFHTSIIFKLSNNVSDFRCQLDVLASFLKAKEVCFLILNLYLISSYHWTLFLLILMAR